MTKIFDKTVKIEFLTNGTSPLIGNLYIGKISTVSKKVAKSFVSSGAAKYYEEVTSLEDMNIPALKEKATSLEIAFANNIKKAPLIEAIQQKLNPPAKLSFDELKEKANTLEIEFLDEITEDELVSLIEDHEASAE